MYSARIYGVVAFALFLAAVVAAAPLEAALKSRKVQTLCDGETVKSVHLYTFSKNEYFSLRDLADLYGARLDWRPVSGTVGFLMNNRRLDFCIKSNRIYVDQKKRKMSLPSRQSGSEIYIPAQFVRSRDFAEITDATTIINNENTMVAIEHQVNIHSIRYYSKSDKTQIVIGLDEDLPSEWAEKKYDNLTLIFNRGRIKEEIIGIDDGVIKGVETRNDGRRAVIKIGLTSNAAVVERKLLRDPMRLVIDAYRCAPRQADTLCSTTTVPVPAAADSGEAVAVTTGTLATVIQVSSASLAVAVPVTPVPLVSQRKKKIIILDAGHGGDDPGAVGPNGTREKEINLVIIKELQRLFDEDGEYEPLLSRKDDTFIPLVERTSLANEKKADLFVSVHCNANFSRDASGFEIYFLSEHASDPDAAATAILENSVVRLEGKPNRKRAQIQELLWSLAVNEFINESSELCSFVTNEATHRAKIENRGVKQAGFYVLRGAKMPAVLVECAFLSNYAEEARLKTKKFQENIADAIFEGVKKYGVRREIVNAKYIQKRAAREQ